jgi:hypothetical protein
MALAAAAGLLLWLPAGGQAETLSLSAVISAAGEGEANWHVFTHLVQLDPANTYTGGAAIQEDTCIRGNGATLDLDNESLMVLNLGPEDATRFDIDHCVIVEGGTSVYSEYGGGIEFGPGTQGWVINNTFYHNNPYGIYLHEVEVTSGAARIEFNIFYQDGLAGIVINDAQVGLLEIRYNDSNGHTADYAMHCGCGSEELVQIQPGVPPEGGDPPFYLDPSNFMDYPGFVHDPADPHGGPADYHLAENSPCRGDNGPSPVDLGAFPYTSSPAEPTTWGALKARFRE